MKSRKIRAFIVFVVLCIMCMLYVSAKSFEKVNTYTEDTFSDVSDSDWFALSVKSAYEIGYMEGTGENLFSPGGNLSVAQIITLCTRLHAINNDVEMPTAGGSAWYENYVSYARENFLPSGVFTDGDYNRFAKRYEVAMVMAAVLNEDQYQSINIVESIPDVSGSDLYYASVMKLYSAGIAMGSDDKGTFYPNNNITRAEATAMSSRLVDSQLRLKKDLYDSSLDDAFTLAFHESMSSGVTSIPSGWRYDNRAGLPRAVIGTYDRIVDTRTDYGVAMIRDLNKVTKGVLVLETTITTTSSRDGIMLQYTNDEGEALYLLRIHNNKWQVLNGDTFIDVYDIADSEFTFNFRVTVDLDTKISKTVINRKDCGTFPLSADKSNVVDFRYVTSDESTADFTMGRFDIKVNYAVHDDFSFDSSGKMPDDWTGNGATVKNKELVVAAGGRAVKTYVAESGKVAAEFQFFSVDNQNVTYSLGSAVNLTFNGTEFTANGKKVYDLVTNIYYRIRLEADPATQKVLVKINGRELDTVDFAANVTSFENISFVNNSDNENLILDDVRVFRLVEHDDYVAAPVRPAGEEKYTVGMNVCSLWKNGTHYGWSAITPYEKPLLGYYDEGIPETADWEIKYMVEHGIDFQAFCWFGDQTNAPLKHQELSFALHDGYMNAKYSNEMKYCLMWECANSKLPAGLDAFKNYFAPYMIENYFKDPRYMSIDNKLILTCFGIGKLRDALGSNQNLHDAFEYLEEEVKKLGYDGMILLSTDSPNSALEVIGIDGYHAYSWSRNGYDLEVNKKSILSAATTESTIHTIPTISVGFNDVAWWGYRSPLMSVEDYRAAHQWVKDEYLPVYSVDEEWKKNFVWLSTWNEFGEGTYIAPAENNGGFGYLDVLREMYTDEKADQSLNTVPTAAQRNRICRMFPQDQVLLKQLGYYDASTDYSEYTVLYESNITDFSSLRVANVVNEVQADGTLSGVTGNDAILYFKPDETILMSDIDMVVVTAKIPIGNTVETFFTTSIERSWTQDKGAKLSSKTSQMTDYVFDFSENPLRKGNLLEFRFDPAYAQNVEFEVESVKFLKKPSDTTKYIYMNGIKRQLSIRLENAGDQSLFAFDAQGTQFLWDVYHEWDRATKTLALYTREHSVVFTVGESTYVVDGKTMELGFELYDKDGLPMLPLQKLCEALEYTLTVDEEGYFCMENSQSDYYAKILARKPGEWDFDVMSDTEGWTSSNMTIEATGECLTLTSIDPKNNDPVIRNTGLRLTADMYSGIEFKVRYKQYNKTTPTTFAFYFITDTDTAWGENKRVRASLKNADSNGEWEVYQIYFDETPTWKDTVIQLRFDPMADGGTMDVDYIRLIENPDYVDPTTLPATLKNGDAEDVFDNPFNSPKGSATLMIVPDSDDLTNNCYKVTADPGQTWAYIQQSVMWKPGQKYRVEYDIKVADAADNPKLGSSTVYINLNIQYDDPNGTVNHVVGQKAVTVSSGWTHCSFTFSVSAMSTVRGKDVFSVYSNPVDKTGVTYYIDNMTITEV